MDEGAKWQNIQNNFKRLESLLEQILDRLKKEPSDECGRKPHRCPICLGSGRTATHAGCASAWEICQSCGGSGILWG